MIQNRFVPNKCGRNSEQYMPRKINIMVIEMRETGGEAQREMEKLQDELNRLFSEMNGTRPLLLSRDSKVAM